MSLPTAQTDAKGNPLPKRECLFCGYEMDAATCIEKQAVRPKPGDFTLCLKCGTLMRFTDGMALRFADFDECYDDDQRFQVRRAQQHIRQFNLKHGH